MKNYYIDFQVCSDVRGHVAIAEYKKQIPFLINRVYWLYGMTDAASRGFHAHKRLQQAIICVNGACEIVLDDGQEREHFLLDKPERGLSVEPMMWREIYPVAKDCVLVVLASEPYDETDYIRDYQDFLEKLANP